MKQVLSSEMLKYRFSVIPLALILFSGVFISLLFLMVAYFDSGGKESIKSWFATFEVFSLTMPSLLTITATFFIIVFASFEQQGKKWENLSVFPHPKWSFYVSKWLLMGMTMLLIGFLFFIITIGFAAIWSVPISQQLLFAFTLYPFVLVLPFVSFLFILSTLIVNQAWALMAGITSVLLGPIFKGWGWWLPWGYLTTEMPYVSEEVLMNAPSVSSLTASLLFCFFLMLLGIFLMNVKES
jgi:hypothetical protein